MPPSPTQPSTSDRPSRAELKKRLREKVNAKRDTAPTSTRNNLDIQGELLRRGVDDPEMLNMAKNISKNPQDALRMLKDSLSNLEKNTDEDEEDDEEEAPPPLASSSTTANDDDEMPPPPP